MLLGGCRTGQDPTIDPESTGTGDPYGEGPGTTQASGDDEAGCTDQTGQASITIELKDYEYSPKCLTGKSTQGLSVKNSGQTTHNLTVEGTGIDVDTQARGETNTESHGLPAGNYTIFCKFHRQSFGMQGTLQIK